MRAIKENNNIFIHFLSSYILFLFSIQILTLGFSSLHVRLVAWLARLILGLAVVVALVYLFWTTQRFKDLSFAKTLQRWQVLFLGFLAFAVITYAILWVAAYIMPDLSWDGVAYHIPTLGMWDAKGYISWINTTYNEPLINGYPKGAELVSYIFVKALGNPLLNTLNLIFLPLGVLGIGYLANSLGAGRTLSLCAGAAFLLIPININLSTTTYVDAAFASSVISFLAMIVYLTKYPILKWKDALITGAAMGLVLSTKSTGLAISGLGIIALVIFWMADRLKKPSIQTGRPKSRKWMEAFLQVLPFLALILGIALLSGGYWYIRNFVHTGSPIYPVGVTIFGHVVFPGVSISDVVGMPDQYKPWSPLVRVFYTWAQGLVRWPMSIKGYDSRYGGLGFLWLFGCFPSIFIAVISAIRSKSSRTKTLVLLLSVVGISFLITPMNWYTRYTFWIYALGLPCLALVLSGLVFKSHIGKLPRVIANIWMIIFMGLVLFEAGYCLVDEVALASPGSLRSNLTHIFSPGTWSWSNSYLFPDMQGTIIETVLDQNKNVAMGPHGNVDDWVYMALVGELYQPIGARHLIFINESQDFSQQIEQENISYVIWDESVPIPAILESMVRSATNVSGFTVMTLK